MPSRQPFRATGATSDNRLQRTVIDKVPRHIRQRAAAEPGRYVGVRIRPEAEIPIQADYSEDTPKILVNGGVL